MSQTRFLIAKFAPDVRRMEPRNFGVVVWSDGVFAAHFAGEKTTDGKIAIRPPAHLHVESTNAYRQWIEYWRLMMSKPALKNEQGVLVKRADPAFVDVLKTKSREQFMLVDAGVLLESITRKDLPIVLKDLYDDLVARPTDQESPHAEAAVKLRTACRRAFDESGLSKRKDYHVDYPCHFHVGKSKRGFIFDVGLHDRRPKAIFHRITLWNPDDVDSMALRFKGVRDEFDLKKEQCSALVYLSPDDLKDKATKSAFEMMRELVKVVNMTDESAAVSYFRRVAPAVTNTSTTCLRPRESPQPSALRRLRDDD